MRCSDAQVRKLMEEFSKTGKICIAALKAGMNRKTAGQYVKLGKCPSDLKQERTWRTRPDPFELVWPEIEGKLNEAPELEAQILFEDLMERNPGAFQPGQLRTFQRKVKRWRAQKGPGKEVFFPQVHRAGEAAQTDFTWANELNVTIAGEVFEHMLCHFVLPYSNWQWATICHSESMSSLKRGIQEAVFRLGGVPLYHQTDHSTAATHRLSKKDAENPREEDKEARQGRGFNDDYLALMRHLGMAPRTTMVGAKEQNGDVEALNGALKRRLKQHLLMRGSLDFANVEEYQDWLAAALIKSNAKRGDRACEEIAGLKALRVDRMPEYKEIEVKVTSWSTIRVDKNAYSIQSRLIGEKVRVRTYDDRIEVLHGGEVQLVCERLSGRGGRRICYRHVIHSLVRKPGAFEICSYREDLFPSLVFRQSYDALCEALPMNRAAAEYLKCLKLAAEMMEADVEKALADLLQEGGLPLHDVVRKMVVPVDDQVESMPELEVDLRSFDDLLSADAADLVEAAQ